MLTASLNKHVVY